MSGGGITFEAIIQICSATPDQFKSFLNQITQSNDNVIILFTN